MALRTRTSTWVRCVGEQEGFLEGHDKVGAKHEIMHAYGWDVNKKIMTNDRLQAKAKHLKLRVPIKPFSAKHTKETDPWLFLQGVFPKSVHEINQELVCNFLSSTIIVS